MSKISKAVKTWNRFFFKCRCGAEDSSVHLGDHRPPADLNCFKCKTKDAMKLLALEPESWGEVWTG